MKITRTITTTTPVDQAYGYLSDFTTTTEWDPGTVRTTLTRGDGGVGTEYLNRSKFLGRETELTYVVEELQPNQRIRLRGSNSGLVSVDTMTFSTQPDGGSQVVYSAEFTFSGVTRLIAPLLRPAFKRLGDHAAVGIRTALEHL